MRQPKRETRLVKAVVALVGRSGCNAVRLQRAANSGFQHVRNRLTIIAIPLYAPSTHVLALKIRRIESLHVHHFRMHVPRHCFLALHNKQVAVALDNVLQHSNWLPQLLPGILVEDRAVAAQRVLIYERLPGIITEVGHVWWIVGKGKLDNGDALPRTCHEVLERIEAHVIDADVERGFAQLDRANEVREALEVE